MVNHSLDYYNTDNTDMRSPLPKSQRVIYCERFEPRSHFISPIQDYVYPDDQIQPTFEFMYFKHSLDYYHTDIRSPLPKSQRVIYCERLEPGSHFNSPIQDYVYPDDQIQPTFEFMYFQHSS